MYLHKMAELVKEHELVDEEYDQMLTEITAKLFAAVKSTVGEGGPDEFFARLFLWIENQEDESTWIASLKKNLEQHTK